MADGGHGADHADDARAGKARVRADEAPAVGDRSDAGPGRSRSDRWAVAAAILLLLVITAVQVLPVPSRLGSHVAPNAGDPLMVTWALEHQARAVLEDPSTIYRANIFHPEPAAIAWSENMTAYVPAYLVAWLASGRSSVVAYNLVSWMAFALGGVVVLALGLRLLRSPLAATIAAAAFTLAPVRLNSIGQTQMAGFAFLALALLLLMDLAERRRMRTAVLAGLSLAALWYSVIYFFVLALVAVPAFALTWAVIARRRLTARHAGLAVVVVAVVALALAPTVPLYLDVHERSSFARIDDELSVVRPDSFLLPPSALYSALLDIHAIRGGRDGHVGFLVLALAVVALGVAAGSLVTGGRTRAAAGDDAGRTARATVPAVVPGAAAAPPPAPATASGAEEARRTFALPLAVACGVGALLAVGPSQGWLSAPFRLARDVVPGLEGARALNRFWTLPVLGAALLAGRGYQHLTRRRSGRAPVLLGLLLLVALLLELLVRPPFVEVPDAPELVAINEVLAGLEPGPVTELPVPELPDLPYILTARQLRSLEDGFPRIEGYSGDVPPGMDRFLAAVDHFPAEVAVAALRQAGVRHVVLQGGERRCAGRYGPEELASIVEAARRSPDVETITPAGAGAIVTLTPAPRGGPLPDLPPVDPPPLRGAPPCERS